MCLIVNRFRHIRLKHKVAEKDIVCYKILEKGTGNFYFVEEVEHDNDARKNSYHTI